MKRNQKNKVIPIFERELEAIQKWFKGNPHLLNEDSKNALSKLIKNEKFRKKQELLNIENM